ncbi:MAG TPA: VOC family protein, partial [Polyangia bacterium]
MTLSTAWADAALAQAGPLAPSSRAQVAGVGEIAMTVSDADRALAFYRDVLGARVVGEDEDASPATEALTGLFGAHVRTIHLRLGEERLALMQFLSPRSRPIPQDQRSHDGGFQHVAIVVADMDAGYAWLRAHHVGHVSSAPQTLPRWNTAAAGIRAFYFSDPDQHTLEIIWFPPGKGDPRWQRQAATTPAKPAPITSPAQLFLGIDHTAIGVADTDASLRLYRDALGLRVAGGSENYGTEQEHLNNVFGAHLRITTLRAPHGPGIELLQYLAPRDGRPVPADLRPSDLLHWQTAL